MTEQLVMPPARVWDRIEKILDDQDKRRQFADEMIVNSFVEVKKKQNRNVYLAAAAGVSLLAGVYWMSR